MRELNYSKQKDASPIDTIHRIRTILHDLGVITIDDWVDTGIEGCYALRVQIAGTSMGTNGKGTNPVYTLASGYAELMERMQNNILYIGFYSHDLIRHQNYYLAPDERLLHFEDPACCDNEMMQHVLDLVGKEGLGDLRSCMIHTPPENPDHIIAVPFYSFLHKKVQYLPYDLCFSMYGSNGMCAGNTPEEALVQGISELMERYVNKKLITDKLTPPTIPDRYLSQFPGLYQMIQEIHSRENGRYRVIVKDCSLGGKYPVVGTILMDTWKGTFGFKIGVHPNFQIALERTLTEAFQGRKLEETTASCTVEYHDSVLLHRDNALNIMKVGVGKYPPQLFAEDSGEFHPFPDLSKSSNKELLQKMIRMITDQGHELLVRDVSYLGFPSYQLVVPGFSELYKVDQIRFKELRTLVKIFQTLQKLKDASVGELERLVRYIKFKRFSMLENQMNMIIGRPIHKPLAGGVLQVNFLQAVCEYKLGRYQDAWVNFQMVARIQDGQDAMHYQCIADYVKAKAAGSSADQIRKMLKQCYQAEIADLVCHQLEDPELAVEKLFPELSCWDCDRCQARQQCCYPEIEQVLKAIKDKFAVNPVDQAALASLLQEV